MFFNDKLKVSGVRITRAGYLTAECLAAKGGNVQRYSGQEVGRPDLETVDVYRPLNEVMAATSLASYAHKPVVVGKHPADLISSRTWKDHAVGHVGSEVIHDGGMVRVGIAVMDENAIRMIRGGVTECSAGYDCRLEFVDGVTETGASYQAVQRDIRIDHLALVAKGRANDGVGRDCKLLTDAVPGYSAGQVARDEAWDSMRDALSSAWQSADAAVLPRRADKGAVFAASVAAASAARQRVLDRRAAEWARDDARGAA